MVRGWLNRAICQHIKDNGIRCGSPALRGRDFCYYHARIHDPGLLPGENMYRIPSLENGHSIQVAVNHILRAMMLGLIEQKQASTMLYAIQIVQCSFKHAKTWDGDVSTDLTDGIRRVVELVPESLCRLQPQYTEEQLKKLCADADKAEAVKSEVVMKMPPRSVK